jgi:hypothetical protein
LALAARQAREALLVLLAVQAALVALRPLGHGSPRSAVGAGLEAPSLLLSLVAAVVVELEAQEPQAAHQAAQAACPLPRPTGQAARASPAPQRCPPLATPNGVAAQVPALRRHQSRPAWAGHLFEVGAVAVQAARIQRPRQTWRAALADDRERTRPAAAGLSEPMELHPRTAATALPPTAGAAVLAAAAAAPRSLQARLVATVEMGASAVVVVVAVASA